jgi:molybdate transport system substrate-binding protein
MSCENNTMRRGLCLIPLFLAACSHPQTTLTVSAAASVQDALRATASEYRRLHPAAANVEFNFGASGALAQQIEQGAPVDIFLSAAPQPMDRLAAKGLLLNGTRCDLLRNDIVLIVPARHTGITFAALAAPAVKQVALGDPATVPAGDYGHQVLTNLGIWDQVRPKLVLAKDVRQVLAYVATGNVEAGIVYGTDARQTSDVQVAAVAPENSHAPVVYPAAIVGSTREAAAARNFLAFLEGPYARAIFTSYGFTWAAGP